jgi:ankyrin repeat protein
LKKIEIPEEYLCPITHEIMQEPVSTRDGYTYEKSAIEKWLSTHSTSPLTNKLLLDKTIIPNLFAKQQITKFFEVNNIISHEKFIAAVKNSEIEALTNVNILDTYLERLDDAGLAPIHNAAQNGCLAIVKCLIEAGADIEMRDKGGDHKGNTPLIWAACRSHLNVIEFLLSCGANPENSNNAKWTAFHWAVNSMKYKERDSDKEINSIKLLLANKAIVNIQNDKGDTGLHLLVAVLHLLVAVNCHKELIKLLLDHGASFKIANNAGETALDVAQKKNPNLAKFMQNYKEEIKQRKQEHFANLTHINNQQADIIKRLQAENESLEQRVKSLEDKVDTVMKLVSAQSKKQAQVASNSSSLAFFQ